MQSSLPGLLMLFLAAAPAARAQQAVTPVVVELYTSQGCVACPPADALFGQLAAMNGVVALALHVDYWDYMGWTDVFGSPEHTARQKAYAGVFGSRTLYTPQIIVQGEDRMKGHDADAILADIARRQAQPAQATVNIERAGTTLILRMAPVADAVGAADVQLVSYLPAQTVEIEKGDNAGRTVSYANIVTGWRTVGLWDGTAPYELKVDDAPEGSLAVVVQRQKLGPVLAAATLP